MKAYTDLSQSKKLAEILSNETSDMYYWCGEDIRFGGYKAQDKDYDIPCWSLAALLNVIPEPSLIQNQEGSWMVQSWDKKRYPWSVGGYSNPVDACVDMILKLKDRNLL